MQTAKIILGLTACVVAACAYKKSSPGGVMAAQDSSMWMAESGAGAPAEAAEFNTEDYNHIVENDFIAVADDPRSTFSIDVDTASYSNTRRFLVDGQLPPADAVRIEELVNYFEYDYPEPDKGKPFAVVSEVGECPWRAEHRLVHIGIQGKHLKQDTIPPRNLVFLVDVSGSMRDPDKLPLLRQGLMMLADRLRESDRVAIVVYAGASGVVLEPTNDKRQIRRALSRLSAGGSTAGAEGLELAYEVAKRNFRKDAINRVILASDGDFNVGPSSEGELVDLIEEKRRSGVFLSVLGFGTGNLNDAMMESIADHGNGNYAYIDSEREAERVLVAQADSTLVTIAKDVKIQVEFNPAEVESYRLIGYENRVLAHDDFNDDEKDAGEIGAGHTVTALYEIVPAGAGEVEPRVDPLKYRDGGGLSAASASGELMTVKIRYKQPDGDTSDRLSFPVTDDDRQLSDTTDDYRFSAAVASFGMLLRDSQHRGQSTWALTQKLAHGAIGRDPRGDRREFLDLVRKAAALSGDRLERAGG
jgi:Ca-activated chloride channel family protein